MEEKDTKSWALSRFAAYLLTLWLCVPGAEGRENAKQVRIEHRARTDLGRALQQIPRGVPTPASDHPGNVFLVGEEVKIRLPARLLTDTFRWQVLDDRRTVVESGQVRQSDAGTLRIGKLGIGWYRVEFLASGKVRDWTTAAVLAQLAEPVPQDSPVCVDSATSWFARSDPSRQENFARLAALAGANWIRDRMSWGEIHPGPDRLGENTTYDTAASLQARHGLKVLQVFHDMPGWATDRQLDGERAARRFPRDLRVLYRFCKLMSRRYKGRVLAWEPWNEANITMFGGHSIDEMCTHQKAAYLGFKAGNPNVTVCWNVYASAGTALHSQGVLKNEAWPYFETYNIHSYQKFEDYKRQFAPAREAACGRPIWITECGIRLPSRTDRPWSELSQDDELRQARFIARSYASSLFAGVNRHFFFILGNYPERGVQFGLLRKDQSPRPGYVALAAVGRLLAGARSLGRWIPEDNHLLRVYAFRGRPDGVKRDVLVIWSEKPTSWSPPKSLSIERVYDYLGRTPGKGIPQDIGPAAIFVVLPKGAAEKLPLEPALCSSAFRSGTVSPVVLQLQMPHTEIRLKEQAHGIVLNNQTSLDIFAYNFSNGTVNGTIRVENVPKGWKLTPDRWEIEIEPMEQKRLPLALTATSVESNKADGNWLRLRGDFGESSKPVLAFRLLPK